MKTAGGTRYIRLWIVIFASLRILQTVQAVSPAPDGGYPGENTAEGASALLHLNGGTYNTAVGWASLGFDVTGNLNTAVGAGTLLFNTADGNAATGAAALLGNTTGFSNTANGAFALFSNSTGSNNTASGYQALLSNTAGFRNNAFGALALSTHQTGSFNNAFGSLALASDQTGASNNAFGDEALRSNITGTGNTAMGDFALHDTNADRNCAFGAQALQHNTDGQYNTAVGERALSNNTTGSFNTVLGTDAGLGITTASNVIVIGSAGADADDSCYIGNIWNQSGGSQAVYVNSDGKLGLQVSSRRFKERIKSMEQASEVIYHLKPVSFHYKPEIERTQPIGFGLIAEDVEKISSDLVTRGDDGQVNSVRYDAVNTMLLNEFLKEHKKVQEQGATISRQQKEIETLATGLQKLSADFELTKSKHQSASSEHKPEVWASR